MNWDMYINRWAIPVIITLGWFWLVYNRKKAQKYLKKKINPPLAEAFLSALLPRYVGWKRSILLPVLAVAALRTLVTVFLGPLHSYKEPLIFALPTSGLFAPIAEEVCYRGIFLGVFVIPLRNIFRKSFYYAVLAFAVLTFSYFFASQHDPPVFPRLVSSLLFSILYLASEGNLLPVIVAHSIWNLFLILNDFFNP